MVPPPLHQLTIILIFLLALSLVMMFVQISSNHGRPRPDYGAYKRFNWMAKVWNDPHSYPDSYFIDHFRFTRGEVQEMASLLFHGRTHFKTESGCCLPTLMALCILMYRLAWPVRWHPECSNFFGRRNTYLCSMYNEALEDLWINWSHLFEPSNISLSCRHRFPAFSTAIYGKSQKLTHCFGFIDGKFLDTTRPIYFQRQVYSGYKRGHGLKFHSVNTPDGIVRHLYGPEVGRRTDAYMLWASDLESDSQHWGPYYLYGDGGYPLRSWLIIPFKGALLTRIQKAFNRWMSKSRVTVEWIFGYWTQYWRATSLSSNLRIFQNDLQKMVFVVTLFQNCMNCYTPNGVAQYFRVPPPSITDYLFQIN